MSVRLETDRLILREVDPERDFEGWARILGDARVVRYLGGKILSPASAWRQMALVIGHWSVRGYGFFSVEEKASGRWIGWSGPWNPQGWPEPEVGWTIAPECWGKGYATEAGAAAIAFAYRELGWRKVIHAIVEGNQASVAVATKLGSRFLYAQRGLPGVTDEPVNVFGQERVIQS